MVVHTANISTIDTSLIVVIHCILSYITLFLLVLDLFEVRSGLIESARPTTPAHGTAWDSSN